ncbi:MAG: C39 family peptidase [Sphingomonadaceae bacterium]
MHSTSGKSSPHLGLSIIRATGGESSATARPSRVLAAHRLAALLSLVGLVVLSACGSAATLPPATATPAVAAPTATGTAAPTVAAAEATPVPPTTTPAAANTVPAESTAGVPASPTLGPAEERGSAAATGPAAEPTRSPEPPPTQRPVQLTATPSVADAPRPAVQRTVQSWLSGPTELVRGRATNLQVDAAEGARLATRDGGYAPSGELLSEVREAEFDFDDAVLSWNAEAPAGTSLRLELRVRQGESWSRWYAMGEWRKEGGRSIAGQVDAKGRVDVDTLKLSSPATALQYRVVFTGSGDSSPLLRQVSVVYSNLGKGLVGPPLVRPAGAARDMDVPRHSQLEEAPAVATKICSPTSLAMVMQYWGSKKSVAEVYAGVRDQTTGIYGNWPLNTAYAGANGFDARVDRFYAVEQLEQEIAAGRPVIISVAYRAGELSGAATPSTDGHLIVVRGFTPEGDVIVNDPIAPNSQSVRMVYKRGELGRIWLRSGGIVYLVSPCS